MMQKNTDGKVVNPSGQLIQCNKKPVLVCQVSKLPTCADHVRNNTQSGLQDQGVEFVAAKSSDCDDINSCNLSLYTHCTLLIAVIWPQGQGQSLINVY